MPAIPQITVEQLKAKFDKKESFVLVDVREASEYETAHIEGSKLIPLSLLPSIASHELSEDDEIIVHCHHGGRSQRACEFLWANGFKNVSNVSGGIDAWSLKIDPKVPRY